MATSGVLRSVWTSFAGLNLFATGRNLSALQRINVPQLSAFAIQSRGIRQGETFQALLYKSSSAN